MSRPSLVSMIAFIGASLFNIALMTLGVSRSSAPVLPSAQRSSQVFRSMTLPALLIDRQGQIVDANSAALHLLKRTMFDLVGQPVHLLGSRAGSVRTTELIIQEGDARRYFELRICELDQDDNRLVLLEDISARKQEEQEREELIKSLESYGLKDVSNNIAHDLKTPLGTIIGFASLLSMDDKTLSQDQRHYLRIIQETSSKMSRMIDELLMFASLHSVERIPTAPVNMTEVVNDVLLRVQGMVHEYEAQIDVQSNLPSVFGYAPWIEEVLANYVSNAIKYGGAPPRVTIGATVRERGVNFWVRDNGQGLSPDQRDVLFKQAARFDSRQRGHGLGLMIVQRILERLGGTAAVESTPGEGSIFSFTLPIDAQAVEVNAVKLSEPGLTAAQRL